MKRVLLLGICIVAGVCHRKARDVITCEFTEQEVRPLAANDAGGTLDIMRQLRERSNFRAAGGGPDANAGGLAFFLASQEGWKIPTVVDEAGLRRIGVDLNRIPLPERLESSGISRRSSLRFVLDLLGIAYYVERDKGLVFSTKHTARVLWQEQLGKVMPENLQADSIDLRREAAFAMGFWHIDPDSGVNDLIAALDDSDRDVRFDAAFALGELGHQAEKSIDALCRIVKSDDLTLRQGAAYALAKIGPSAIEELLGFIDDPDSAISLAGIDGLRFMGSAGNDAVPALIAAGIRVSRKAQYRDKDGICKICRNIGSALSQIEMGDAVVPLRELFKSDEPELRSFAAFAIGEIGSQAISCEKELQILLSDGHTRVRRDAAHALARLDLPHDTSTEALETAAKDADRYVSLWATEALRVIKSKR